MNFDISLSKYRRKGEELWVVWCEMEHDGTLFHHSTQNRMHFKTHGLFASGIFHLISLDHK